MLTPDSGLTPRLDLGPCGGSCLSLTRWGSGPRAFDAHLSPPAPSAILSDVWAVARAGKLTLLIWKTN